MDMLIKVWITRCLKESAFGSMASRCMEPLQIRSWKYSDLDPNHHENYIQRNIQS